MFLFSFFIPGALWAAPYPATSSSAFTNPQTGHFLRHKGFSLQSADTNWLPREERQGISGTVIYSSNEKANAEAALSVRTDKISKTVSMELYTRKWMKDYPNYGFEILAAKNFVLNGSPALVVDLLSRAKNKQLRQVVLKNKEQIAILTCIDNKETFNASLQSCNRIIKTFSWNLPEEVGPPSKAL